MSADPLKFNWNLKLSIMHQMKNPFRSGSITLLFILFICNPDAFSKTRWSTVHLVPDADLLPGGSFVLEGQTYFYSDDTDGPVFKPTGMTNIGLIEWVNIQMGYAGGFNMGLKARILGETKNYVPSLAIGITNIFSHKEAYYFGAPADTLKNELYLVFGKSIESAKIRFHLGIQSIPGNSDEIFNPFLVIEKYLGKGFYITAEVYRRDRLFHPSIFTNWRMINDKLEFSLGAVDLTGMFMHEDNKKGFSFSSTATEGFVRPGVWMGIRFEGKLGRGKNGEAFMGLEDRLKQQNETILAMRSELDSLKNAVNFGNTRVEAVNRAVATLIDSSVDGQAKVDFLALQKLINLKSLYDQEPFEPEQAKKMFQELVGYRGRILPALSKLALDRNEDSRIKSLAISVMGEIGSKAAADVLLEILAQAGTPEMKIEALIALGKVKETRAVYLMQQLANDPNDAVSFTASEVLQKLEKETGVSLIKADDTEEMTVVPERKIGGDRESYSGKGSSGEG